MDSTTFLVIAIVAIIVLSFLLFLALFEPGLDYRISTKAEAALDSEEFMCQLEAVTDAKLHRRSRVEVLTNGEVYYAAELAAIRAAEKSINLEAYIFQKGEVARKFVEALTERASAGVEVRLVLDAIGSFATWDSYFKELRRLEEDFARDLQESRRVTYEEWRHRSVFERMYEWLGWLLERQQ
jgi:cardiolipin synthase